VIWFREGVGLAWDGFKVNYKEMGWDLGYITPHFLQI
jgi:hypothetical protein